MTDDKYPPASGRRRFVKGVVGGATLSAVGAVGAATINSSTSAAGQGGGSIQAMAIENIDGPAPRGMPQIPLDIDAEGYIRGAWPEVKTVTQGGVEIQVAETEDFRGTGITYSSEWFQYCGVESYAGIDPAYESDNYFRSPEVPGYTWQEETYQPGDRLNREDFADYETWGNGIGRSGIGKPAMGRWRSENAENTIPIQVLRSTKIEQAAQNDPWVAATTQDGFIAWLDKCTHFCCVPGFKQTPNSAKFDAEDEVYCPCHQSVYDPFTVVQTLFVARPRPTQ